MFSEIDVFGNVSYVYYVCILCYDYMSIVCFIIILSSTPRNYTFRVHYNYYY